MTSSEMHFGPSWMHKPATAGSRRSAKASTAAAASPAATADPSHPTYSAITRDQHTSPQPSAPSADDALLDPTKPFKYSKEFMLAQWDEGNLRERPLPIEFERWGVVFREEGGEPVSSKALTETEKKLFALSYNPDRRPGLSSNNSGLEPTLSHRGERRNARPTAGGERSTTGSDRPLNSPARERFGGIEGGVLGGIGRGPGSGVAGEGKLGGLGARGERGTRERRTLKDGESDIQVAPLPPSSTQSWRPTRALSSNNPPSADQSPIEDSPAASKRWREPVTSAKERSLTSASANDDNDGGDSSGTGGGGFGGGSRAGGWRDRERHKTAERELGAAAGWVNVSKDDHSKSKLVNGRSVANSNSGNDAAPNGSSATGYSNAFAALDQDGDENELASGVANLAVDAQQLPIRSTADTQREELSNVKWTYKDPQGELQGPFMATEMQAWFSQGYFPESLLVKRESDLAFETVGTLVRLTSDQSAIFLQPAPIRPAAPPGLISRVSTPGYASPTTSWAQQQDNANVPGATASALDQFLRQHEGGGKPGLAEDLVAGMAAGGRWESSPHQSPVIQHQLAQQAAAAAQYGAAAPNAYPQYDPYGNSSPGPRHMAAYRQGPIAPSPYASPVIQHQAVSPWGQQQQPQQVAQSPARSFYGGGGLADNLGSPVAERAGVYGGYGPQGPTLAPGAGWAGSNDWRAAPGPVPPQQFMNHPVPASVQQQQQYAQQQQQQQQQQTPWQQPSLPEQHQQQYQHQQQEMRQEQPVVTPQQQQQAPLQEPASAPAATGAAAVPDEASQTPVSRWAQSLAGVAPSPVPAPLAVQQQQEEASTAVESAAQTASPVPAAAASSPISANATVPATPIKGQPNAAVQLAAVAPAASPASVKADGTPQPSTPAAAASAEDLVVATPAPVSAPAPAPAPTVAPWAKEDKKAPAGPSLREIQEAEARKAAAAKAARAASAAASGQPTPKESSTAESSPALPSSMSWGLAGSGVGKQQAAPAAVAASTPAAPVWGSAGAGAAPAAPQRTLKQIQEDETRQKQKAAQAKAAQAAAVGGSVPKAAYSGAASSTSNNNANSGAWATVGAGGKTTTPVPKVAVPGAASPRPLAQAVPPKAAPVASIQTVASKLSRTGSSASLDEIPPSTEFLSWAKTALRSVTGMNIDEFLQMLLTFPLNPDSAVMEIISDSVYANSPTLDGRRFAQEFVTRRKTDAKGQKAGTVQPASSTSAGRGGSLADIVKAQPKPAPDAGFGGFKVVKKKGKK